MYEPRKRYPITLKQAKELCRNLIGRLPRCGYEVDIYEYESEEIITSHLSSDYGKRYRVNVKHTIYLENCAGQYRLGETTHCKFG